MKVATLIEPVFQYEPMPLLMRIASLVQKFYPLLSVLPFLNILGIYSKTDTEAGVTRWPSKSNFADSIPVEGGSCQNMSGHLCLAHVTNAATVTSLECQMGLISNVDW
jgi:hypothetical protein